MNIFIIERIHKTVKTLIAEIRGLDKFMWGFVVFGVFDLAVWATTVRPRLPAQNTTSSSGKCIRDFITTSQVLFSPPYRRYPDHISVPSTNVAEPQHVLRQSALSRDLHDRSTAELHYRTDPSMS